MLEWLQANGWDEHAGHDEGIVLAKPLMFLSLYNGDGVWHLFDRHEEATYEWATARARGWGLSALQKALAAAPTAVAS